MSIAAGAALVWLTVLCWRAYNPQVAIVIAALSLPVYVAVIVLQVGVERDDRIERELARSFIAGDATVEAEARASLAKLRAKSGSRPAGRELAAALESAHDIRKQRAIIDLLGAFSRRDSVVVNALVPLTKRGVDPKLRSLALKALVNVDPYVVSAINVRYTALAPNGLLLFALPRTHRLFGDSVAIVARGVMLPRSASTERCEAEAAIKAGALLTRELATAQRVDLSEVWLTEDGEFGAFVSVDGNALGYLLRNDLPSADADSKSRGATAGTDWCAWL